MERFSDDLRALIPERIKGPLKTAVFTYRRMSSGVRPLPDFLVIGAARSGTTSLYRYLERHPAIAAASMKEIHYFSIDHWRGVEWYRAHFPTAMTRKIMTWRGDARCQTGEATPYYLFHPLAPERIAEALPDIKLMICAQEPYRSRVLTLSPRGRAWDRRASVRTGYRRRAAPARRGSERIRSDPMYPGFNYQHFSYLSRGIYCDQLVRWFSLFPRERFLILESERFWAEPQASHVAVLRFLGLPPIPLTAIIPQYNRERAVEDGQPHQGDLTTTSLRTMSASTTFWVTTLDGNLGRSHANASRTLHALARS